MKPKIRNTHPNLYRLIMVFAAMFSALAVNFHFATPTFLVYHLPNDVWAACFLALGLSLAASVNLFRSLRGQSACMALAVSYLLFFAAGTSEPFLDYHLSGGKPASIQLPIVYLGLAALAFPVLIEPFVNPWTAARKVNGKVKVEG